MWRFALKKKNNVQVHANKNFPFHLTQLSQLATAFFWEDDTSDFLIFKYKIKIEGVFFSLLLSIQISFFIETERVLEDYKSFQQNCEAVVGYKAFCLAGTVLVFKTLWRNCEAGKEHCLYQRSSVHSWHSCQLLWVE